MIVLQIDVFGRGSGVFDQYEANVTCKLNYLSVAD